MCVLQLRSNEEMLSTYYDGSTMQHQTALGVARLNGSEALVTLLTKAGAIR